MKHPHRTTGMTLIEILIAVCIIGLAIIPIYRHISGQAAVNLQTEKIQMADKILQSIKEEMMALPYKTFTERSKTANKNDLGQFVLTDDLYPVTLQEVLAIQKKYKDFQVTGSWFFLMRETGEGKVDNNVAQVDVKITWSIPGAATGPATSERTRSFVLVAPK